MPQRKFQVHPQPVFWLWRRKNCQQDPKEDTPKHRKYKDDTLLIFSFVFLTSINILNIFHNNKY